MILSDKKEVQKLIENVEIKIGEKKIQNDILCLCNAI